eukprot:CAMPEP_0171384958 /NCGR_PEP_ID=MMETSP0879-20121228/38741_1 /TAXON_ID=67004 /ORGANISM="Thalassiosira weissflogii, Strain CCMP1336" /LENGTH=310 /DNA_ID=CAMNT_0011897249 /DNA_START=20 /DNA_END=952 /DNA_ORIENTATION=+
MPDEPNRDAFVASMTFANKPSHQDCICDECGAIQVPAAVREAVQRYLLKRKLELPIFEGSKRINITQRRELVKRDGGFSVWKLVLPRYVRGGDPIVEYRNNHRILFIEKIPKSSIVFSIGKGIIGSAAEENSRTKVDWDEGRSYFFPCLKGIACGWIHKQDGSENNKNSRKKVDWEEGRSYFFPCLKGIACGWIHKQDGSENNKSDVAANSADSDMEVVVYILKVSSEVIDDGEKLPINMPQWVKQMHQIFCKNVGVISPEGNEDKTNNECKKTEEGNETRSPMEEMFLSEEDSESIREIIRVMNGKCIE